MKKRIVFLSMIVLFGFAVQASAETTQKSNKSQTEIKSVKQTVAKPCCAHHAAKMNKSTCAKAGMKTDAKKGAGCKCGVKM
jgi:uncharacterized membrane protein